MAGPFSWPDPVRLLARKRIRVRMRVGRGRRRWEHRDLRVNAWLGFISASCAVDQRECPGWRTVRFLDSPTGKRVCSGDLFS